MHLLLRLRLLFYLLFGLLTALNKSGLAQSTNTILANPDNGRGYFHDNLTPNRFVEFNQALYAKYIDANNKGRLVKFDGTTQTLIPNPTDEDGVVGELIVFNNALYMQYIRTGNRGYIAKFDGKTITLLNNPPVGGRFTYPNFVVFNNTLYGQYQTNDYKFYLVKIEDGSLPNSFSIKGVGEVSCTALTSAERELTFTPQYSGLTGQGVTFWVVNEVAPTTTAGPYTIKLFIDNPTITLKATQGGTSGEASYRLNWLAYCPNGGRVATNESAKALNVTVMPNPGSGHTVDVLVEGAANQPVSLQVTDQQGKPVSHLQIGQAGATERSSVLLGAAPGIYLLNVSTPTQVKTLKVIKQ